MSKLRPLRHRKPNPSRNVLVGLFILVLISIPVIVHRARVQAANLVASGDQAMAKGDWRTAMSDYQIALWLQPNNRPILSDLANAYQKANRPNDAVATLERLGIGESGLQIVQIELSSGQLGLAKSTADALIKQAPSTAAYTARSRVELEQGSTKLALSDARLAVSKDTHNQAAITQLGLCLALADNQAELSKLVASVGAPQALQAINPIDQGKIALAYQLYASGLLRSSQRVLLAQTDLSASSEVLLGQIDLSLSVNAPDSLNQAQVVLLKAVHLDPSNLKAHELLLETYSRQGNKAAVEIQAAQIQAIKSGDV